MNSEVQSETVNTTPVMSSEERIKNLEERVAKLEKIEKDRKTRRIIMICIKLFFYLAIIIAMVVLMLKLKTYYDTLTNLKNLGSGFNLDTSSLSDFDITNYFQGLLGQ